MAGEGSSDLVKKYLALVGCISPVKRKSLIISSIYKRNIGQLFLNQNIFEAFISLKNSFPAFILGKSFLIHVYIVLGKILYLPYLAFLKFRFHRPLIYLSIFRWRSSYNLRKYFCKIMQAGKSTSRSDIFNRHLGSS